MKIKQINGQYADINIQTPETKEHFLNPYNYTDAILDQFEHDIYKEFITEKDKVILDIGANVGLFSLHVSPWVDKIICVEPTPEHMKKQREILDINPKEQPGVFKGVKHVRVIHEESALANQTGKATFYWCGINTTMNSLQNRGDRSFEVNTITLEDLCKRHELTKVDFCKIDIEGSEWQAITEQTVRPVFAIINKVFIELHPPTKESQDHFKKIFEAVGYKVDYFIHDSLFCYK